MEEQNSRKRIILLLLIAVGLLILLFLYANSVVIIEAPSNDLKGSLQKDSSKHTVKLSKGHSKTLLLSAGTYSGQFNNGSMATYLSVRAKHFLIPTHVTINLHPQKQTFNLGQSYQSCAADQPNSTISIYFDCKDIVDTPPIVFDGNTQQQIVDSYENGVDSFYDGPYMGNLLSLAGETNNNQLTLGTINLSDGRRKITANATLPRSFTLDNFSVQTDTAGSNNPRFTLYDKTAHNFLAFDSADTAAYKTIQPPPGWYTQAFTVRYRLADNKIYAAKALPSDFETGEGSDKPKTSSSQAINIFNIDTGRLESTIKLSKDFRLADIFVGPGGKILVLGHGPAETVSSLYAIEGHRLSKLNTAPDVSDNLAWVSADKFYYSSGNKIFSYSFGEQVSYLVYTQPGVNLSALSETANNIYLSTFIGDDSTLTYFRLSDIDLQGSHTEPVLPFENDLLHSIKSVRTYKSNLYLETVDNSAASKDKALDYLKSLGINLSGYQIKG